MNDYISFREEIESTKDHKDMVDEYKRYYENNAGQILDEDEDKEGGIGVREPRKPIKPSDKDSIAISHS